ncbi:MAG TPA: TadE/TadG family type IV pilus assembly protein [Chloroflexota bacterium]
MKRFFRSERGSTATEFALIAPVLLLFMFGIMEGSRVLNAWIVLTNETREAARYGIAGQTLYNASTGSPPAVNTNSLTTAITNVLTANVGQMLDRSQLSTPAIAYQCNDGDATWYSSCATDSTAASYEPSAVSVAVTYSVPMVTPLMSSVMGTVPVRVQAVMKAE